MIKNYVDIDTKLDKVNDECGVFGIYRNDDDIDVVAAANDALFSLQHRGQQSAGITVNKDGEFTTVKELGMVLEGMNALPAALELAERYQVEMPIVQTVNAIVNKGMSAAEAVKSLMERGLKNELPQGYEK